MNAQSQPYESIRANRTPAPQLSRDSKGAVSGICTRPPGFLEFLDFLEFLNSFPAPDGVAPATGDKS